MATKDEYITRSDLGSVTQKVMVENSKAFADPLIKEQRKGALRQLEENAEAKQRHIELISVITDIVPTILKGLFSFSKLLIKAPKSIFSFLFKLIKFFIIFAGIVKVFDITVGSFVKIGRKLSLIGRFLDWLTRGRLGKSNLGKFVVDRINAIRKWFRDTYRLFKAFSLKKLRSAGRGVFSVFERIGRFFSTMVRWARKYNRVFAIFGTIGRIFSKILWPLTLILSVFDFVTGFIRGYNEGGILKGLKEGFNDLFDGLFGNLIRLLAWIPKKIAEFFGLDNFAKELDTIAEEFIQGWKDLFGGTVDLIEAIFTFDGPKFVMAIKKIWSGLMDIVLVPFKSLRGIIKDAFGTTWTKIKLVLVGIKFALISLFDNIYDSIMNLIDYLPDILIPQGLLDFDKTIEGMKRDIKKEENALMRELDMPVTSEDKTAESVEKGMTAALKGYSGFLPDGTRTQPGSVFNATTNEYKFITPHPMSGTNQSENNAQKVGKATIGPWGMQLYDFVRGIGGFKPLFK